MSKLYDLEVLGPKGDVIGWVHVNTEEDTNDDVIERAHKLISEYEMLEAAVRV